MLAARILKRMTLVILPILSFVVSTESRAEALDSSSQFASSPLEYATLMGANIKTNIIFLVDNSPYTPGAYSLEVIFQLLADPAIKKNTRSGLAYLYADSHPFFLAEIPGEFLVCLAAQLPALGGLGALGPGGIAALGGVLAPAFAACSARLNSPNNFKINSHFATEEIPLSDTAANAGLILASLNLALLNPPSGLPVITRRYYEITQEMRGLTPVNSFKKWEVNPNAPTAGVAGALGAIANSISDMVKLIPDLGFNSGLNQVLELLATGTSLGANKLQLLFTVPEYRPLFKETMLYRCAPNLVVIISSGIVSPAVTLPSGADAALNHNPVARLLHTVAAITKLPDLSPFFFPKFDFEPLKKAKGEDRPLEDETLEIGKEFAPGGMDFVSWETHTYEEWNRRRSEKVFPNHYANWGLAYLSAHYDAHDLKSAGSGFDREGKSWDAPDYPTQTIDTLAIAAPPGNHGPINMLFAGLPPVAFSPDFLYLKKGSTAIRRSGRRGFFAADENAAAIAQEIKNYLSPYVLMAAPRENLSGAASAVLTGMDPTIGVTAAINTQNWTSELRFYRLIPDAGDSAFGGEGSFAKKDFTIAGSLGNFTRAVIASRASNPGALGERQIIVSTGEGAPTFPNKETADRLAGLIRPTLGDIVNAPILAIDEAPNVRNRARDPYPSFIVTAANDGMVHLFKKTGRAEAPYRLALDYLPAAAKRGNGTTIWQQLESRRRADYGRSLKNPHQYFNNGGIAYFGAMKKTCGNQSPAFLCTPSPAELFLVGAYGQGARGLYALNLAGRDYASGNPIALANDTQSRLLSDVPLWESGSKFYGANAHDEATYNANQRLGYIIGAPVIANVALTRARVNELNQMKPKGDGAIKYAVFAPNGFFSDDSSPTLYVFDVLGLTKRESVSAKGRKSASFTVNKNEAGKLIAALSTGTRPTSSRAALGPPAVVDLDGDEIADVVYAGDYDGNLYRFDLRYPNPKDWTVNQIFAATEAGTSFEGVVKPARPITTAPVAYRLNGTGSKYVVLFGTGSDLFADDLTAPNAGEQALYGIFDNLAEEHPAAVTKNDLLAQTMSHGPGYFKRPGRPRTVVTITQKPMSSRYKGWVVKLTGGKGERVVRPGILVGNTAFFTTRFYNKTKPVANQCTNPVTDGAEGYLIGLNPRTGGGLKRNMVNLNPATERYLPGTKFISGFKLSRGVPSEPAYSTLGQTNITNASGQFQSGWENYAVTHMKDYAAGYLILTSSATGESGEDYYVIALEEPRYIRVRRVNARVIF